MSTSTGETPDAWAAPLASDDAGLTVWLTGLPSSGKTTLANALAERLSAARRRVELLDGDAVRPWLSGGLGFSRADRDENVRRVGWVAHLLARNGVVAICALVSPYRQARQDVRDLHDGRFFEVHVAAPVEICAERDVKGLYARAQRGDVSAMTGVDDPYEEPLAPELVLQSANQSLEESLAALWAALNG